MKPISIIRKLNESAEVDKIEKRIKEIEKQLDYCRRRDEVCATFGAEQEVYELEQELEELKDKLDNLDESMSPDVAETEHNEVLNDFRSFIEAKYDIKSIEELNAQLKEVTEEDINEFFTDKFYDEDDMDKLNAEEDAVRSVYPPVTDESIFEPTPEDIEEMKYWYNDNPADLYAEKEREYDGGSN